MSEVDKRRFGKYWILAHLATGGMAEIQLATHSSLGGFRKLVVLKRILPNLAQEERFVRQFLDEARIAAKLHHPNVVDIFDLGRIDGHYYIAMEYLRGESLSALIRQCQRREQRLPSELAAGIVMQAAEGLHHAHTLRDENDEPLRIVHRDVSPHNIFVLYDGGVKVVDFGIAKAAHSASYTRTGMLKGKYAYMSPEQILTKDLDARSDVFSLGIVLWECLTCRKLFQDDSDLFILQSIVEQQAPSPKSVIDDLPDPLANIANRALARDRNERYQSAAELRADLAGYLKGASQASDTVAIARFMTEMFAERRETKRTLITKALSQVDLVSGESVEQMTTISQTEASIAFQDHTPVQAVTRTSIAPQSRFANAGWWLAGLLLAVLIAFGTFAFWPRQTAPDTSGANSDETGPATRQPEPIASSDQPARSPSPELIPDQAIGSAPKPDSPAAILADPAPAGTPATRPAIKNRPAIRPRTTKPAKVARNTDQPVNSRDPVPEQPVSTGSLDVACLPWCEIHIDGKPSGHNSPLRNYRIPAGEHRIEAINPPTGARESKTVRVPEGGNVQVRFRLK